MTLIHAGDRIYVLPPEPMECGRCGAMSGTFINRFGDTCCVRCHVEARSLPIRQDVDGTMIDRDEQKERGTRKNSKHLDEPDEHDPDEALAEMWAERAWQDRLDERGRK
jgi:hypothetical protein